MTLFILGRGRTKILLKWYHEELQQVQDTYGQGSGQGVVIRTHENVRRDHRIRNQYIIRAKWYDVCELLAPFRITGVRMAVRHRKKKILNKSTYFSIFSGKNTYIYYILAFSPVTLPKFFLHTKTFFLSKKKREFLTFILPL